MSSAVLRWTFGPFAVDPANACLWRGTEAVALSPKAFDVLYYLVQHPNRVVTKDEILDAVWPETSHRCGRARLLAPCARPWTTRRRPASSPPCRAGVIASWRL